MSKAEQLREAIDEKLMEQHYAALDPKRDIVTADDMARAIVSTLGITRDVVRVLDALACTDKAWMAREEVTIARSTLSALLDLAEGGGG